MPTYTHVHMTICCQFDLVDAKLAGCDEQVSEVQAALRALRSRVAAIQASGIHWLAAAHNTSYSTYIHTHAHSHFHARTRTFHATRTSRTQPAARSPLNTPSPQHSNTARRSIHPRLSH